MAKILKTYFNLQAVLIAVLLTPGSVLLAWSFDLHSFGRMAKICLMVFPAVLIAALIYNWFFKIDIRGLFHKKLVLPILASLGFSLLVVPFNYGISRFIISIFISTVFFLLIGAAFFKLKNPGQRRFLPRLFLLILLAASVIGIAIYLYMSLSVRMYADDFCFTNDLLQRGFFNTLVFFYNNWSGRVFADFFMFSFASSRWFPFTEIILYVLSTFFFLKFIKVKPFSKSYLQILAITFFLPFAVFYTSPDPYKSLYWITNTALVFPLMLVMTIFLGFMIRGYWFGYQNKPFSIIAAFLLALAVSTSHEVVAPAMILLCCVFLGTSIYLHMHKKDHDQLFVAIAATLGMVIGTAIVVLAPGNYVRKETVGFPDAPQLIPAMTMSLQFFKDFLIGLTKGWKWLLLLTSFAAGYQVNGYLHRKWQNAVIGIFVIIGSCWGAFFISTQAMSSTLPTRTQILTSYFLCFGLFLVGAMLPTARHRFEKTILLSAVVLMLGFALPRVISNEYRMVAPIEQFAKDWDQRDSEIKSGSKSPYIITIPWDSSEQSPSCMSDYYLNWIVK